jgi:hypothetical protein
MHDGYIFTLGIAGSAGGPVAACLDIMLAALPPVKRAAYLGDVLTSVELPSLDDPFLTLILGDVADAEVLLIVTPFLVGRLPPRLTALAHTTPSADRQRFAALVTLGDGDATPLRAWLHAANAEICAELALPANGHAPGPPHWAAPTDFPHASAVSDAPPYGRPDAVAPLAACARAAYAAARALHPSALQ